MKKILFSLILSGLAQLPVTAQTYFVKNDGDIINYTNYKIKGNRIKIKDPFNNKLELDLDQIKGYYSLATNKFYYSKPKLDFSWGNDPVEFVYKVLEGKINVYERIDQHYTSAGPGMAGSASTNHLLFAEKDDNYIEILTTGTIGQNKKEKITELEKLVNDDPLIVRKLNAESYRHKYDEILSLISEYNVRAFKEKPLPDEIVGKVVFFRRKKKQLKEPAKVIIRGKTYEIPKNSNLEITLPYQQATKVCITNTKEMNCHLVSGSKYFTRYYEISLDKKGLTELKNTEKKHSEFYISQMK